MICQICKQEKKLKYKNTCVNCYMRLRYQSMTVEQKTNKFKKQYEWQKNNRDKYNAQKRRYNAGHREQQIANTLRSRYRHWASYSAYRLKTGHVTHPDIKSLRRAIKTLEAVLENPEKYQRIRQSMQPSNNYDS